MERHLISFRVHLQKGQNEFQLENPQLINSKLRYEMPYVSIIPGYFSDSAFANELDSKEELAYEPEYSYSIVIKVTDKYISKNDESTVKSFVLRTSLEIMRISLHELCITHYEPSTVVPPFVIDYFFTYNQVEPITDCVIKATEFYGEQFNNDKHGKAIPDACKLLQIAHDSLKIWPNPCIFPINPNLSFDDIRIRITLAPNMHLGFSNNLVLNTLGFTDEWINTQCLKYHNQLWLVNYNVMNTYTYIAPSPPQKYYTANKISKVYLRSGLTLPDKEIIHRSPTVKLKIKSETIRQPIVFANEFQKLLLKLFHRYNLKVICSYNQITKKFSFTLPTSTYFHIDLHMSSNLLNILGYINVSSNVLNRNNLDSNVEVTEPIKDILKNQQLAQTLVYDTGLVSIVLTDVPSNKSFRTNDFVISTLCCVQDGTMTSVFHNPVIPFSQFERFAHFQILQFDEGNQYVPLKWPHGYFIQGILVGHV